LVEVEGQKQAKRKRRKKRDCTKLATKLPTFSARGLPYAREREKGNERVERKKSLMCWDEKAAANVHAIS
jgi:hypothetical protein